VLLRFGEYELDTDLFELRRSSQSCPLEPQVFDLLLYLIRNRERIVSRRELLDELWAGKVVTDSTLSSRVKAARKALGDSADSQRYISTLHRRGYRFVAAVDEQPSDAGPSGEPGEPLPVAVYDGPQHGRPCLAVLPFSHNHGSEHIAWIAEVLSEDISILLARIPGFVVISRNSAAYYRGREFTIRQVGRELGADYVIQGSVWEVGDKLRVSVQLLETAGGSFLWTDRTEIPADRLTEFLDEVLQAVVSRIEPALNRAEFFSLRQRQPVDLDAWALYRQAHALLSLKGWSEESFRESADLLRQAVQRDPGLAFAHAYLALTLTIGHLIGLVHDEGWQEEAVRAAETALALDGQDSDVLGYTGCAFADMGDLHRGIGLMRRAVELDPSNAQARAALGAAMIRAGDPDGVDEMRRGMRISPRDTRLGAWGAMLAWGLLGLGRVKEAIEAAERACTYDDRIFLPRLVLAMAHFIAGNVDAARVALNDARRLRPQLSIQDIANLASAEEIARLKETGFFNLG